MQARTAATRNALIDDLAQQRVPERVARLGLSEETSADGSVERVEQVALRARPHGLDGRVLEVAPENGAQRERFAPVVCTISPTSAEPMLMASQTIIDGYTQPGAVPNSQPLSAGDNARLTIHLDGITAGPNSTAGLQIDPIASANLIGGSAPAARNLVSGNGQYGLYIVRSANNKVYGNLIGTDRSGLKPLGNHIFGILLQGSENYASLNNVIGGPGGPSAGLGNVVSANGLTAVAGARCVGGGIELQTASGNTIKGNFVGTNAPATGPLGNGCFDLGLYSLSNANQIGGPEPAAGNVIAGDAFDGVDVSQGNGNTFLANDIGLNAGMKAIPNARYGAWLYNGSSGDQFGTTSGIGNVVAYNGSSGILIGSSSTDSNHVAILQPSMFGNGSLGIDLAPQGVVNCSGPAPGPNDYTPCPIISFASPTKVTGTACASCLVQVFVATNEAVDMGHGEGMLYVGSNVNGDWYPSGVAFYTGQTVPLAAGNNLVGMPFPATGLQTTDIAGASEAGPCNVQKIAIYSGGAYTTWTAPNPAFLVPPTAGAWIQCTAAMSWTPQ